MFSFLQSRASLEARFRNKHAESARAALKMIRLPDDSGPVDDPSFRGSTYLQNKASLLHGADQIEYLIRHGKLPRDFLTISKAYRDTISVMVQMLLTNNKDFRDGMHERPESACFVPIKELLLSQHWLFNTLVYFPGPSIRRSVPALNPNVDWAHVEDQFLNGEVVVIDQFLSPWAVEAAYRFCLEATLYFEYKPGYLGAYLEDGFMSDVLHHITQEMRIAMPRIIGTLPLMNFWSYKYSNDPSEQSAVSSSGGSRGRASGTKMHSDAARVNLNLWVTPDEANLDPSTGGLSVWDYAVSTLEEFRRFQEHTAQRELEQRIQEVEARAKRVPHRRNRVVLFDSNLVHESMPINFAPGYENRRINLTWLFGLASFFGEKEAAAAAAAAPTPQTSGFRCAVVWLLLVQRV
jgi:hypothetical protein